MHLVIYSPRDDMRREWKYAIDDFIRTSFLDLQLHSCRDHTALMEVLTAQPIDLLFYDMEGTPGAESCVWEAMRTVPACSLVLIGDDTRRAVFGYGVRAVDFLLTPVDTEDLLSSLARLIRSRQTLREQYLPIKLNRVWGRLSMAHIVYVESTGHHLVFHMDDGRSFRMIASFKEYQPLLDLSPHFFRCHKSYVVNLLHVDDITQGSFILKDGSSVSISRPYRQSAYCFYTTYLTQHYNTGGAP